MALTHGRHRRKGELHNEPSVGHLYLSCPENLRSIASICEIEGLSLLARGRYAVAVGSTNRFGHEYEWATPMTLLNSTPPPLPNWILRIARDPNAPLPSSLLIISLLPSLSLCGCKQKCGRAWRYFFRTPMTSYNRILLQQEVARAPQFAAAF